VNSVFSASAGTNIGTALDLIDVRLMAIRYAARDTHLYEFRRLDGAPLPPAEPGAHVDVHLPNGMMRQFSLTIPDAAPKAYVLGVKLDPASRGGTKYIFDKFKVGDTLKISAPRNNFRLVEDAPNTTLIAGGIGVTPIWAMVQRLEALGRPWELYFSSRSRTDMAYLETLETMARVTLHFDDEAAGKFLDLAGIVAKAPKDAHLYCCGPTPMLSAFEAATKSFPSEQVHLEYFTAKVAANLEGGFVVQLARSGKEFAIPPGQSILGVLRDAGLNVPYSCEEGICGACETVVISGIPDHRDSVLTDKERAANKTMMICCGGSKSEKLVLDI
jgi:ferredoxin-NADP reductase